MANTKSIAAHIFDVRETIRQTSDDSIFSDLFIYKKLLDARSKLLYERIRAGHKVGGNTLQKLCYEAEYVEGYSDCQCINSSDDVHAIVTDNIIPEIVRNKFKYLISVTSLDGTSHITYAEPDEVKLYKYTATKGCKPFWHFQNGKIVILNAPVSLKAIYIQAVFYDPIEAIKQSKCVSDDLPCSTDPKDVELHLDPSLFDNLYSLVYKSLAITPKLEEDLSNNAESPISPTTK